MAQDLTELELSALYDLLATYTTEYTQILRWGSLDELKQCGDYILELQNEIDTRKNQPEPEKQQDKDLDDGLELVPVLA